MRLILSLQFAFILMFLGCSPSREGPKCDACEIQGQRVSFCENEDGSYHLASGGETITYSTEDLEAIGLKFGEMKEQACNSGEIPKKKK